MRGCGRREPLAAAAGDAGTLEEAFSLTGAVASLPLEVEVAVAPDDVATGPEADALRDRLIS